MTIKKGSNGFGVFMLCMCLLTGCQNYSEEETQESVSEEEVVYEELKEIAAVYKEIYEEAYKDNSLETVETKQQIADCLGKEGYSISDEENQIDMINPEPVEAFCETAMQGKHAEVAILQVMDNGGLIRYDLKSSDGELDVIRSTLFWENNEPKVAYYEEYEVHTWSYTDKGYLLIEKYQPEGYDGMPGETGIRVKPLDRTLRELNQKYVMPVGYACNKLLITDWDTTDYSALDFYDLYEILYPLVYETSVPYDGGLEGKEFEVPKKEFEEVIQTYFDIDSSVLQGNTAYNAEKETYRYRTRGMYDAEMPYGPYPEVVAYEELEDGTLKLTVEGVWIRENMDRAIVSEFVVRPLENGGFQYVSNRVIASEGSIEPTWYHPRLSEEEWVEKHQ